VTTGQRLALFGLAVVITLVAGAGAAMAVSSVFVVTNSLPRFRFQPTRQAR
jgi:cation transport ATPase